MCWQAESLSAPLLVRNSRLALASFSPLFARNTQKITPVLQATLFEISFGVEGYSEVKPCKYIGEAARLLGIENYSLGNHVSSTSRRFLVAVTNNSAIADCTVVWETTFGMKGQNLYCNTRKKIIVTQKFIGKWRDVGLKICILLTIKYIFYYKSYKLLRNHTWVRLCSFL